VVIALGIEREVEPALVVEHLGKPFVVAPVRLHHDGALGPLGAEELVDRVGLARRVPARPQFAAVGADGRPQQGQTARAEILRLLDPGALEAFQRLDRLGGVVAHALEDDEAAARGRDPVAEDLEFGTNAERRDLALDQALARLRERLLHLADADREHAILAHAIIHQHLGEEMRLAGAAAAVCALIARRLQQRDEGPVRLNV